MLIGQRLLPTDKTGSKAQGKDEKWKKANAGSWSDREVRRGKNACRLHNKGERKLLLGYAGS